MPAERITLVCFAASYAVALAFEVVHLLWPRAVSRLLATSFGVAGLLAHSLFLLVRWPALETPFGSLLYLAWIVAVFGVWGSVHHRPLSWGVFVLPTVCGLIGLATAFPHRPPEDPASWATYLSGDALWARLHGLLLVLAATGLCVGFTASVMYLWHARQLQTKALPSRRLRLLSLERLETMNRRALHLAFPLLSAGAVVGLLLLVQHPERIHGWSDPKIVATTLLWLGFALLLVLRYRVPLRGRRLALLTILAFGLLLVSLASAHGIVSGGGR